MLKTGGVVTIPSKSPETETPTTEESPTEPPSTTPTTEEDSTELLATPSSTAEVTEDEESAPNTEELEEPMRETTEKPKGRNLSQGRISSSRIAIRTSFPSSRPTARRNA